MLGLWVTETHLKYAALKEGSLNELGPNTLMEERLTRLTNWGFDWH